MFSQQPRGCRALAAEFHFGASKSCVLQCLSPWAIKNVVFSRVWGAMAPKASLVTCLGRLGYQNRPKGTPKGSLLLYLLVCWFEGRVFFLFLWFSGGSDPRSARAGAVETQFCISGVASKRVSFLQQLLAHFWYIWRRNFSKRHFEIELENKSCKSVCCFAFWLFWAPFWTPYGASFLASGAWVPSKRQGFLEPGGLEPPKVVSHPVWGHWRFRHIMFS